MTMMRTVLAVDELLGRSVMKQLGDVSETLSMGRMEMSKLGPQGSEARLRELVLEKPSVLLIGGRAWNALPMLKAMKLPYRVPVVVLAPAGRIWELLGTAEAMRVFAVIAPDRIVNGSGIVESITSELCAAWTWVHRRRKPGPPRVPEGPAPVAKACEGRVVPLFRSA